jgi:hypothetical protein
MLGTVRDDEITAYDLQAAEDLAVAKVVGAVGVGIHLAKPEVVGVQAKRRKCGIESRGHLALGRLTVVYRQCSDIGEFAPQECVRVCTHIIS